MCSSDLTDFAGNVYVVDNENHKIQMISSAGVVTSVEGAGIYGYSSMNGRTMVSGMTNPYSSNQDLVSFFLYCAFGTQIEVCGVSNDPEGYTYTELPKSIWKDSNGDLLIVANNRLYKLSSESSSLQTISVAMAVVFLPTAHQPDHASGAAFRVFVQTIAGTSMYRTGQTM